MFETIHCQKDSEGGEVEVGGMLKTEKIGVMRKAVKEFER